MAGICAKFNTWVAVTGTAKAVDCHGPLENKDGNGSEYYWNVYKFTMPQKGLLNVYLESTHKAYFYYGSGFRGFAIFSVSDPDNLVWRSHSNQNRIEPTYSAAREIYHGTADVALEAGEYYFTFRQYETSNVTYFLTLSYKESDVNVTSISLNKKNIELEQACYYSTGLLQFCIGTHVLPFTQKPIKLAREPCLVLWLKRKMEEIHILSV